MDAGLAHLIPLDLIFRHMAVKLDPAASADKEITAVFKITDAGQAFTVMVRRGVAEIRPEGVDEADLVIRVEEKVWKEVALGVRNFLLALAKGEIKVDGNKILKFKRVCRPLQVSSPFVSNFFGVFPPNIPACSNAAVRERTGKNSPPCACTHLP